MRWVFCQVKECLDGDIFIYFLLNILVGWELKWCPESWSFLVINEFRIKNPPNHFNDLAHMFLCLFIFLSFLDVLLTSQSCHVNLPGPILLVVGPKNAGKPGMICAAADLADASQRYPPRRRCWWCLEPCSRLPTPGGWVGNGDGDVCMLRRHINSINQL